MCPGDTLSNTTNFIEIYEKLTKYEEETDEYKININWNKVKIIA